MQLIHEHEISLAKKLYTGLAAIKKVQLYGPPMDAPLRAPTMSFTYKGKTAKQGCVHLAKHNICGWSGHFYAIRATEVLGLLEQGGVTRLGMSVYNVEGDIDRTLEVIERI